MKSKSVYLIYLLALLPTIIFRDYTPNNELRYLSIVDEALGNGSIFTFTNQGEIYADKPPLHFWLMMMGKQILGEHRMWYYSLLSFIPALVILMIMSKWLRREEEVNGAIVQNTKGSRNGFNQVTASLMLMTSGLFSGATLIVRMDMLMNMFIVLSLYTFYKMYKGEASKRDEWIFPIYLFLALFSKGPLGLLIPFVATLLFLWYKKELCDFKKYWGWKTFLILFAGCIVWFAGVYMEGGSDYLKDLLVRQTIGRGVNSFHHKEPFYYYLISTWYILAPWSLLAIRLFIAALAKKRITGTLEQFFTVVILSTLVLLSVISSKIAIYSLPVVPFFIYLTVMLFHKFDMQNRGIQLAIAIPAGIFLLALPVVIYMIGTGEMPFLAIPLMYAGAGVLSLSGLFVFYFLYREKETFKAINTMALGLLLTVFIVGWSMPSVNSWLGWGALCKKAMELSTEYGIENYHVYNISRAENMDVYFGKDIVYLDREEVLIKHPERRLIIFRNKDVEKDLQLGTSVQNKERYQIGKNTIVIF